MNGGLQQYARVLNAVIAEHTPTYTLDKHITEARARMGEERWAQLNAEWEA